MNTLKKLFCMILIGAMLFSFAGCDNSAAVSEETPSGNTDFASDDDDFFGESVENIEGATTTSTQTQGTAGTGSGERPTKEQQTNYWKELKKNIPSKLNGKTIKVYNWNPMSEYPGLSKTIQNFTKETNIKVEWITENYDTYLSKLASLTASDKAPDIARTHSGAPHMWNVLQPISESGFKDFSNSLWDQAQIKFNTAKGKTYSINTTDTIMGSMYILFYNKSLINKYGFDDPYKLWKSGKWTLEVFEQMLYDFKNETSQPAYSAQAYGLEAYLTNMYGFNGEVYFDGTKYVTNVDNPEILKILQHVADLRNKDGLIDGANVNNFDKGNRLFYDGSGVLVKRLNSYAATVKSAGALGTVPYPTVPERNERYSLYGGEGFGIPKGAKYPEALPYYVFYVTDKSRYDLKTFFPNEQAQEVYEYLQSLPASNKFNSVGWDKLIHQFYYGDPNAGYSIFDEIKNVTGAQIAATVASNKNLSQQRADDYNALLSKLP